MAPALPQWRRSRRLIVLEGDLVSLNELPQGVDAIIHMAAASPETASSVHDFIHDNVLANENLVCLAKDAGVRSFIFFSSLSVYGEIEYDVVDEATPVVNPGAYGVSKLLGEMLLRESADAFASIALRIPAVLGLGASRHWLARAISNTKNGDDLRIFNPNAKFNNAVHLDDLSALIQNLLQQSWSGFDFITLGADGGMTIQQIADKIIAKTKSLSKVIVETEARPHFTISSNRAKRLYGYAPTDFETMLDQYIFEECGE